MSSPPLMPVYSAPATTTSKRLSLNISTGPRPLHLIDSNISLPNPGPATAPIASSFNHAPIPSSQKRSLNDASTFARPSPRRQSSISYRSESSLTYETSRSLNKNVYHEIMRSAPGLGHNSSSPATSPRARTGLGTESGIKRERQPLTLAEKHSDLLHTIAHKEAKCLELRTQLAAHESELLQLKQKWGSIVSRGLVDSNGSRSPNAQNSGAVLDGIREGVQGVGRFITAGLAIGELSPAPAPPPTFSSRRTSFSPAVLAREHASSPSDSSNSTCATVSTRFSQSSTSSLSEPSSLPETAEDDNCQILMVHDTGATPTMSPNPVFEHQCQQRRMLTQTGCSKRSSLVDETNSLLGDPKSLRRRSRDSHSLGNVSPLKGVPSPNLTGLGTASHDLETERQEILKSKRASLNLTEFPPASSIPGLASLTMGVASSPQVSSWMGSVGKKWEELQRGSTFYKSQKRASTLFTDVSNSIVSVLSPPSSASSQKPLSSPAVSSATSTSLLDVDDDDFVLQSASPVLVSVSHLSTSRRARKQNRTSITPSSGVDALIDTKDDEEWNW